MNLENQNDTSEVTRKKHPQARKKYRNRISSTYGHATDAGLNCPVLHAIGAYLRFYLTDESRHGKKPVARRLPCKFCGKQGIKYRCVGCNDVFCMAPPTQLIIPGSDPPRKFRHDGPFCWHRVHGISTWKIGRKE